MQVKLVGLTYPCGPEFVGMGPEEFIAYCARVSSPNQDNPEYVGLLKYCIKNKHFSVFEQVDMNMEIITSRAIAQQILRHRSFTFQEFSQRYAQASLGFETYPARRQDAKNRQNSIDDMDSLVKGWFERAQNDIQTRSEAAYNHALGLGIAKEQARFLLPLSTTTRLYMKGSVRSWIHYLETRCDPSTQKEHRDIANAIKEVFCQHFPATAAALDWHE